MYWMVPWVPTSTKNIAKSSISQKLKGWSPKPTKLLLQKKHPTEVFFLFLGPYSGSAHLLVHNDSWWEVADTCLPLPLQNKSSPLSLWSLHFHFDLICNCICLDIVLHSSWSSQILCGCSGSTNTMIGSVRKPLVMEKEWTVPHTGILVE